MSNIKLKSMFRRGSMFGLVAAFVVSAFAPAIPTFADALNPLTDRSLTLSSSSPGWDYKDGSGNTTYAPPNSGANGKKTGNTFDFKVSTDTTAGGTNEPIKAFSFQYCTTSAGNCLAPGNNGWTGTAPSATRNVDSDTNKTSDLSIHTASPSQIDQTNLSTYVATTGVNAGAVTKIPAETSTGTNYIVMYNNAGTWTSLDGWTMTAHNVETGTVGQGTATGATNQIELVNTSNTTGLPAGTEVKIVFFGTDTNYITNPGDDAFFVKINTYKASTGTASDPILSLSDVIDGGVTVANVMNQSIQITTKVLETMQFSVGTVDPDTLTDAQLPAANGNSTHAPCDPIVRGLSAATNPSNTLQLGDENGEFSLDTNKTYSTHSYWRLSSNSSAGATVYYSGVTLQNTVGDNIDAIGSTASAPVKGKEQFGLAIANGTNSPSNYNLDTNGDTVNDAYTHPVDYTVERGASTGPLSGKNLENGADNSTNGIDASTTTDVGANPSYHAPQLYPLKPNTNYDGGAGTVNADYNAALGTKPVDTAFAFDTTSNDIPVAIATESSQVVDCVTAKMRYIANIAATTPAGIYTTKINYIAAPQY